MIFILFYWWFSVKIQKQFNLTKHFNEIHLFLLEIHTQKVFDDESVNILLFNGKTYSIRTNRFV